MEKYSDFKQKLIDLKGKRVRICFYLPEMLSQSKGYDYLGKILEIDEETKCVKLENDPHQDEAINFTHINLEATVIYAIDEIDPDADLSDQPEKADYVGERTEYIPYDKEGNPMREPQEGYVILHKDHIYAKGTVYTLLREKEAETHQSKEKAN